MAVLPKALGFSVLAGVVTAGPGQGPEGQSQRPGPDPLTSVPRTARGNPPWSSRQCIPGHSTNPPARRPQPLKEEEVARPGLAIGPGAREGKLPGQNSFPLPTLWEGMEAPWVGIVLLKVGQVPALLSAGAGPDQGGGEPCETQAGQFSLLHP